MDPLQLANQLAAELDLDVTPSQVMQVYEQSREIAEQIDSRQNRDDLMRLFVTFASATAAGPMGWAALIAGNLWAMWKDGIDTSGSPIYWPQDIVPDRWECLTNATFSDERIGQPADGFACRPIWLDPLPSSPPSVAGAESLAAWEIANEVRQAIAKGRPGIPSERRRAAMWARRLLVGGALEGSQGQIKTPGVPQTAREVWAQAQRGVSGINTKRVLHYLWQMLTRVDEWGPLLGWVLIDPTLLQGHDEYLPAPEQTPSATTPRVVVGRTPVGSLGALIPPVRTPGPTPEPEPEPVTDDEPEPTTTDDDQADRDGGLVPLVLALVGLALPFFL